MVGWAPDPRPTSKGRGPGRGFVESRPMVQVLDVQTALLLAMGVVVILEALDARGRAKGGSRFRPRLSVSADREALALALILMVQAPAPGTRA